MSDVGTGLAYLCATCCCMRDSDVTPDGSHFRSKAKRDPREQAIEDEFIARNYSKDASGRIRIQPTPTNSMLPTQLSDESKKSGSPLKVQNNLHPDSETKQADLDSSVLVPDSSTTTTAVGDVDARHTTPHAGNT